MALYVARGLPRLLSPRMFAEDGTVFLADSHNRGPSALVHPYAGYLHLVPRIIAALLEPAPLVAIPFLYGWIAVLAYLLMISPVLSSRIAWLIPGRSTRALTFVVLCLLPSMDEIYGNIANLINVGGISLFLLLMSADPAGRRHRVTELVALGALGLSGPYSIIFAPLFVYRWLRNGCTAHSMHALVVMIATATVQGTLILASPREVPGGTVAIFVRALIERVGGGWLFGSADVFAGTDSGVRIVAALWVLAVSVVALLGDRKSGSVALVSISLLMISATEAYGASLVGHAYSVPRQILIPHAIVVITVIAVAGQLGNRLRQGLCASVLLLGTAAIIWNFALPQYANKSDMAALQACTETNAKLCSIPIYREGWRITLTR